MPAVGRHTNGSNAPPPPPPRTHERAVLAEVNEARRRAESEPQRRAEVWDRLVERREQCSGQIEAIDQEIALGLEARRQWLLAEARDEVVGDEPPGMDDLLRRRDRLMEDRAALEEVAAGARRAANDPALDAAVDRARRSQMIAIRDLFAVQYASAVDSWHIGLLFQAFREAAIERGVPLANPPWLSSSETEAVRRLANDLVDALLVDPDTLLPPLKP